MNLVIGSTGSNGSVTVNELSSRGLRVRALRNPNKMVTASSNCRGRKTLGQRHGLSPDSRATAKL